MLHLNPTVFIVDPDPAVRVTLDALIRRAGWWPEFITSTEAFLARPRRMVPGCILLDLLEGDRDGFVMQRRIATERRETPVIVISQERDVMATVRAMKAGAVDFALKPLAEEEVLMAVSDAIARSRVVLEDETELLNLRRHYDCLSAREKEVMGQVVAGLLNKQVGAVLGISEITVKAHRGRVMRKMAADSLAELVNMSARLRLAPVKRSNALPFFSRSTYGTASEGSLAVAAVGGGRTW